MAGMATRASKPKVRFVLAPNPSMMTQNGTNTYILGTGRVAVIDPGPAIDMHLRAILSTLLPQECISHIFVTHAHLDHSELVPALVDATGATVYAYGAASAGRSAAMQRISTSLQIGGGEGVDLNFSPDIYLQDGEVTSGDDWSLEAVHTPGHMGNHLCFASGQTLFSGDHVMGWSTTLVSPPEGDMADYVASLKKLSLRQWTTFLPGHGEPIADPSQRLADLITHRIARETAILEAIADGASDITAIATLVYQDLPDYLVPAANRNILAHLIDLEGRNLITAAPFPHPDGSFTLA
jgi:glyoxylase-like metal-dependent hydrolase (beta-lactamase superfamily II)